MISQDSLTAEMAHGAERTFCSRDAGWSSVLLRGYKDTLVVDDYTTAPTADQKLVLVTTGACHIEGGRNGVWQSAAYRPGHIGLVAPGVAARLRWRGAEQHRTLQLHLPGAMIPDVATDLLGPAGSRVGSLQCLSRRDAAVGRTPARCAGRSTWRARCCAPSSASSSG